MATAMVPILVWGAAEHLSVHRVGRCDWELEHSSTPASALLAPGNAVLDIDRDEAGFG